MCWSSKSAHEPSRHRHAHVCVCVEQLVLRLFCRHLRESVAEVGKRGRVVHIAHSQGALITSLAAKKLSPLEMSQIEVLAFGGAVALRKTPETPFARVVNYYSVNDPLLLMVPTAAQALRSGLVADEEFCFLAPRVGDPIRDHDLLGPTYRTALGWEGIRFQQTYQSILYRSTRPVLLFALFVIQQLHLMIQAIIKQTIRFLLWVWAIHEPWLEGGKALAKRYIVVPTLQVVLFVYAWLQEVIRLAKREDKYVQVQVGKQQDQP